MVEISVRMDGQSAMLDFGPMALDPKDIEGRLRQILPIVERLLEAEVTKMSLDASTLQKRFRGIAAQGMVVDAAIWATTLQAALLMDIVSGSESIADHGFPEFSDE